MRRAAALPTVLFALCLIGALTVGGAHVARHAADDARVDQRLLALSPLADEALAEWVAAWDPDTMAALPVWGVRRLPDVDRPGAVVRAWAKRLSARSFWFMAEAATTSKPLIQKRLAVLLLVDSAGVQPAPGITWFELP